MNSTLIQLLAMRLREYRRTPSMFFSSVLFPIIICVSLGFMFSGNSSLQYQLALVADSQDAKKEYLDHLRAIKIPKNDNFTNDVYQLKLTNTKLGDMLYHIYILNEQQAATYLVEGKINAIIHLNSGKVQHSLDVTNDQAKLAYLLFNAYATDSSEYAENENIILSNHIGKRYIDFLIPGILALVTMNSFLWGVAFPLVDLRSRKLLKRMNVTPMNKAGFMFSYYLARLIIGGAEAIFIFVTMMAIFSISIIGSPLTYLMVYLAGTFAFWGVSLALVSRIRDTKVAQAGINLLVFLMIIFSGALYDYSHLPGILAIIAEWSPLTIMADGLRSVMNGGEGFAEVNIHILVLMLIGLSFAILGIKTFKWY